VAKSIYITSTEGRSGKSTVVLGVLDALSHVTPRVGVFRAIARSTSERDYVLEMLLDHVGVDLDYEECIGITYDDVRRDADAALAKVVERFKAVEAKCDAVVIVGSDFTDVGSIAELGYNARIAANLGTPLLVVLNGRAGEGDRLGISEARTAEQLAQATEHAVNEIHHQRAELLAVIANRADPAHLAEINDAIRAAVTGLPRVGDDVVLDHEALGRGEAEDLLRGGDLLGTEGRTMGGTGVLGVRRRPRDDRAKNDQARP